MQRSHYAIAVFTLVALALMAPRCPNEPNVVRPLIASFALDNGAPTSVTGIVYLNNACVARPLEYSASESGSFAGASWLAYTEAPEFTLSAGTGTKTVYFKVRDSQGRESAVKSDTIERQATVVPIVTGFAINGGAAVTYSTTVRLDRRGWSEFDKQARIDTGTVDLRWYYMASESSGFEGASWQLDTGAPVPFTFANSTPGVKTVYFKLSSQFGTSAAVSDTIRLSNTPPTFGDAWNEVCNGVRQTTDGGYIFAGAQYHPWDNGWYSFVDLTKAKPDGTPDWSNVLSTGEFWGFEEAKSVQQTEDGGFILAGQTEAYILDRDMYLQKNGPTGNFLWCKTFGGPFFDWANCVQQTSDGGYILAGRKGMTETESAMYLVKTDAAGNLKWEKTFSCGTIAEAFSVRQTSDGGYILAGHGIGDVYVVKTDANGNFQWHSGSGGANLDAARDVQQTSDGGYVLAGWTGAELNKASGVDVYAAKIDANGDWEWEKTFGGDGHDAAYGVQIAHDGGYVFVGGTGSFGAGGQDVYLVKTDSKGDLIWQRTFGGPGEEWAAGIDITSDWGFVLGGTTDSFGAGDRDMYLVRTDAYGIQLW